MATAAKAAPEAAPTPTFLPLTSTASQNIPFRRSAATSSSATPSRNGSSRQQKRRAKRTPLRHDMHKLPPLESPKDHEKYCILCSNYKLFRESFSPGPPLSKEEQRTRDTVREERNRSWKVLMWLVSLAGSTAFIFLKSRYLLMWKEGHWQDHITKIILFVFSCAPLACCIGFFCAGLYYFYKHVRRQNEKAKQDEAAKKKALKGKNRANDDAQTMVTDAPTLVGVRYDRFVRDPPDNLREVVAQPPMEPLPAKVRDSVVERIWNRTSAMWKPGYNGREHRGRLWDADQNGIELKETSGPP